MKLLNINTSSNRSGSVSQHYGQQLIALLKEKNSELQVVERHTTYSDLPFIDETMLGAFFSKEALSKEQEEAIAISENLVEELKAANVIVITAPIYNFSVPASLKAYFDLVARAGKTFKYSETGPVGLLEDKKAYVVMSSGGTAIGSDIDFAGRYVEHFLNFLGITNVEMIKLDQLMIDAQTKTDAAKAHIDQISQEPLLN